MKVLSGCTFAVVALLIGAGCETTQPPPRVVKVPSGYSVPAPSPADIKAMSKAGVSDEVIMSQIRNSRVVYHLTTAEILDMKEAGASQKVIDFMINTPSLYPSPRP